MNTTVTPETEKNKCEHCDKIFVRHNSFLKHICEKKRRYLDRDCPPNRIGFHAWKYFFKQLHPNKKESSYNDFINSNYYTAFVNFGSFCVNVKVVSPSTYTDYLLKNRIPIAQWDSDRVYTSYLTDYLQVENHYDAVKRSIENMLDIAYAENINISDVFKYANTNKLCYMISSGKISPWVIYQSTSGKEFLSNLDEDHTNLIFEYIDPDRWNVKFKREPEYVNDVKEIINKIPL